MLNILSQVICQMWMKSFVPLLWKEIEGNSQGNSTFVLVEILLAKMKILLSPLFHTRSQQLSLQLRDFQQKYEADCKISIICIALKYQDSGKDMFFHYFSQHGNVLCFGSPVTAIRSWDLAPDSVFWLLWTYSAWHHSLCHPAAACARLSCGWQHLADGGSGMEAVGVRSCNPV